MGGTSMESICASPVTDVIISFIKDNFIPGLSKKELSLDESLFDNRIIDSLGILELIMFLEEKYSIKIEDDMLIPEYLDTVNNIVNLLSIKGIK